MNEMMIATAPAPVPAFDNKALQIATNKIFKIGETVRKCAFETAFIMAQVEATECFKDDGFNSVHEWAMKTFGFKKSASYTLLRVGKEYTRAILDAKGKVKGYGSNLISQNAGVDFTTTQIEKMLPGGHDLAVELVETAEITPDMTCKEIEKVIKARTSPEPEETDESEETDEPETNGGETEPEHFVIVTDVAGNKYNVPFEVLEQYRVIE